MSALPAYRHVQVCGLLWIVLPLTAAAALAAELASGDPNGPFALAITLPVLAASLLCLGRLVIELREDRLRWQFGYLGWPRWEVALADIRTIERVRAPSLGGSGIKGSRRDRLYNVTIGGPALKLSLADGRTVTLGTPEPERLAAFLEARLPRPR